MKKINLLELKTTLKNKLHIVIVQTAYCNCIISKNKVKQTNNHPNEKQNQNI